jgi:hypothetical protein
MEQTECSETSAYKIQTPGNYPEESIQKIAYFSDTKSFLNFVPLFYIVVYSL